VGRNDKLKEMTMISSDVANRIALRSVTADESELVEAIGKALGPSQQKEIAQAAGLKLPSPAELGKRVLQTVLPPVKFGICSKLNFCKNRKTYDSAVQVAAMVGEHVADAIGKSYGIPEGAGEGTALVIEVSAAILKKGLNKLCECPE
jgi:hypothetical protein